MSDLTVFRRSVFDVLLLLSPSPILLFDRLKGIASDRREMEDGERREIEVEIDDDDSDGRWEEVEEEEEVEERQQKSSSTSASSDAQKKKASGSAEEEAEEEEAVRRIDYTDVEGDDPELGAYGLWNDGYDYSKHLRTVGGGMIIEANDAPDLTKVSERGKERSRNRKSSPKGKVKGGKGN